MHPRRSLGILVSVFAFALNIASAEVKPKYGPLDSPRAIPLARSSEYFRNPSHPAPDFWALISYYVPQFNGAACSAASVSMVLNAARAQQPQTADQKNISQEDLLNRVETEHWKDRMSLKGYLGSHGLSLDRLGKVTEAALKTYGFPKGTVKVVTIPNASEATQAELKKVLLKKRSTDFILANFNQRIFTDDADVGHIAPVGAYDPDKNRVLILDPDREYYGPYWVSMKTFLQGMATLDGKNHRGYILIRTQGEGE